MVESAHPEGVSCAPGLCRICDGRRDYPGRRYAMVTREDGTSNMEVLPMLGGWVKHEDYAALEAENIKRNETICDRENRIEDLDEKLAALEQAARLVLDGSIPFAEPMEMNALTNAGDLAALRAELEGGKE